MSQFSVLGQCCRYDENHGKWRKRAVTACLSCVFNHHNSCKTFFLPTEQSQAKILAENHVGNHNVPRWQWHFRGFRAWKYIDSRFFAWTNVLKLSLWPRTYNMSFLRIPGVTFASKVEICKLVMFCPKYLIWRQVLFLNLMQRPEKLFHNVILVIFSLKNVNRTPYLEGNIQLFHLLCKTQR